MTVNVYRNMCEKISLELLEQLKDSNTLFIFDDWVTKVETN